MTHRTRPTRTFRAALCAGPARLFAVVRAWCRADPRAPAPIPLGVQVAAAVAELRELSAAAAFADPDPAVCYEATVTHAELPPPAAAVTPPALAVRHALAHPGVGDALADWLVREAAARTNSAGVLVIARGDSAGAYALAVAALINAGSPHLSVGWRALP